MHTLVEWHQLCSHLAAMFITFSREGRVNSLWEVSVGEWSQAVSIWEEEAVVVRGFCTHWSLIHKHSYWDTHTHPKG